MAIDAACILNLVERGPARASTLWLMSFQGRRSRCFRGVVIEMKNWFASSRSFKARRKLRQISGCLSERGSGQFPNVHRRICLAGVQRWLTPFNFFEVIYFG